MSELVWIHRTNANELGISQTENGTGRGSFILVPVEARKIFFPRRDFNLDPDINENINIHFINENKRLSVKYSRPISKTEHRLSLAGLNEFIGEYNVISPNRIICFYRKDNVIHFSVIHDDSIYGRLLSDFPVRGKDNNLVTQTIFDNTNFNKNVSIENFINIPKPFLILAGISGTGKTRFVREQAKASGSEQLDNYQLVAVRPDWHEPSDLLGYVSHLNGEKYIATDVLRFIVKAWQAIFDKLQAEQNNEKNAKLRLTQAELNRILPYWLCLDEMNLAPVEQYFADYLSALELREWGKEGEYFTYYSQPLLSTVIIAKFSTALRQELNIENDQLWHYFKTNGIGIPFNLIVAGTVNMDETTHGFSRKVLDRALSLDFSEFYPNDFAAYFAPVTRNRTLTFPIFSDATKIVSEQEWFVIPSIAFLQAVNAELAGTPFKLAYRALNELLLMAKCYSTDEPDMRLLQSIWDDFLMMKVLPRIEGDEAKLWQNGRSILAALDDVLATQLNQIWQNTRIDLYRETTNGERLENIACRSKAKLAEMQARLQHGFTHFWP